MRSKHFQNQNKNGKRKTELLKRRKNSEFRMLTYDQKILMAQMIFNEKVILFSDFGPNLTKVEKQEKWMEIVVKLNSIGANIQDYKVSRGFF